MLEHVEDDVHALRNMRETLQPGSRICLLVPVNRWLYGPMDRVDHHYGRVFGMTLAIGLLSGLASHDTSYGLERSAGDVYRQGVSQSMADSSLRTLERYLNILPTFTVQEGHRIKIYLSGDLTVPAANEGENK